jgi:succinate dehydrogenase (ubiquinone) iron-sulfur subunit
MESIYKNHLGFLKRIEFNKSDPNKKLKRFDIFRFDSEDINHPAKYMSYHIDLKECGPMVLDALIKIKDEYDPTLSFRRSCREGICGSCSMNIDGRNTLACLSYIDTDTELPSYVRPLPYFNVVRDLVVDMTNFYTQYKSIHPYLQRKTPKVLILIIRNQDKKNSTKV